MTKSGIYKHYKGHTYVVLGTISNATNDAGYEKMVLYHSTSHHGISVSDMLVRRESEFHEEVEVALPDGKVTRTPRFCLLE